MKAKKKCSACKMWFALSGFYRDRRRADGHGAECKECAKARTRRRRVEEKSFGPLPKDHDALAAEVARRRRLVHERQPVLGWSIHDGAPAAGGSREPVGAGRPHRVHFVW